jgi:oligopeptide transport system substrate-binding protein
MDISTCYCSNCGAANQAEATKCFACGQPLSTPSPNKGKQSEELLHHRYRIINLIGTGGYAAVYRAWDTHSGNLLVAIKEINLQGLTPQEAIEATDTFNRELTLLSTLAHPNLPRVLDHFTDPTHWYLVMDFIDGETLEQYLHKTNSGKLPLDRALNIGLQLCAVLDFLHTRQPPIIFRDLKPANIMQTPTGHLYLIDFGTARHLKPGQQKDTIALGSPGYAAPEQYGKSQSTQQADIYSLGATLHHLLTGNDPSEDPFRFAALRSSNPSLPAGLETLVQQMLDVDPNKRPASIAIVKEELQRIAVRQSSALYEPRLAPFYAAPSLQTPGTITTNQTMLPRSFMSNMKRLLTSALVIMLVISIIGGSFTLAFNGMQKQINTGPYHFSPLQHASLKDQVFRGPIIGNAGSLILDPARATDTQSSQIVSMIYTGLVSLDDNLNIQPQLASSYTVSPDQLIWTFHLRPALKLSDGTPLTAHDIAYSIDRALQPATHSAHCMTYLGLIKYADQLHTGTLPSLINQSLLVPDDNTLVIQLSKPAPYFLTTLAYPCSYVVEKHLIDLYGNQMSTKPLAEGGSGPFQVAQYDPGRQLHLEPNPNFAGPQPQLKNVIFHFYKDITASYQAYQAGQLDITEVPPLFYLNAENSPEFQSIPQLTTHYYTMNYLVKPFDNLHIRQAFAIVLNRDLIVRAGWHNSLLPSCHILPMGIPGYNPNLLCNIETNGGIAPGQAKALLQQGIREEGWSTIEQIPPITLTYAVTSGSSVNEATAAQQMWLTTLGILVKLHPVSASALQQAITSATNNPQGLQFWAANWSADYPDPHDLMSPQFADGAPHNNMNYGQNSSADAPHQQYIQHQLEIAESTPDPLARTEFYDTVEQQLLNDVAWIPIYQVRTNFMHNPNLINWRTNAASLTPPNAWSNIYISTHNENHP